VNGGGLSLRTAGVAEPQWLAASVLRMGLAGETENIVVTPLTGGVSSDVYAVTVGARRFCVKRPLDALRVAADWQAPVERAEREQAWLRFAAGVVPSAVPHVIAVDPVDHAFAMELLDERVFVPWKTQLMAGHLDARTARWLGERLADVHLAAAAAPDVMAVFSDESMFRALRIEPYFGAVAEVHPALRDEMDQLSAEVLAPRTVIHGDVSPKNVLVADARVVLLDAECASVGDPAFDVAFCLTHLILKAAHSPSAVNGFAVIGRAFVAAYTSRLTPGDGPALCRRVSHQVGGLLLARVDGKSPVEYLSGEAQAVVRRLATTVLIDPPDDPMDVFPRIGAEREGGVS
jgi:aminoglycoside phosphotransferase (APT) family kinase protein